MTIRNYSSAGDATAAAIIIFYIAFWLLAVGGWIWNIFKFAGALAEPVTGIEILRGIGIAMLPLGAVLGFF